MAISQKATTDVSPALGVGGLRRAIIKSREGLVSREESKTRYHGCEPIGKVTADKRISLCLTHNRCPSPDTERDGGNSPIRPAWDHRQCQGLSLSLPVRHKVEYTGAWSKPVP